MQNQNNEIIVVSKPTISEVEYITNVQEMDYRELVKSAKDILRSRDLMSLKIAKMALVACEIKHGGRSSCYTLTDFARDVGMPYKTLSSWTITYRTVVHKIEDYIKTKDDWNKAKKLSDRMIKERTIIRRGKGMKFEKGEFYKELNKPAKEMLEMFKALDKNSTQIQECSTNIKRALFNIRQVEKQVTSSDETFLFEVRRDIHDFLKIAEAVQTKCEELIKSKRNK